ncbi:DUF6152 family protein [Henriciella sp. AS95]|uniref:DUF6152 family protein n=1 Tax=Henriciella sp. AS95 TaxID=3135782 RepID=UPI00316BF2A1
MKLNNKLYALAGVAAGSLAIVGAASAHHAFSAEFDAEAPVLLRGEVTKVEWVNPHTWIHLAAEEEDSEETVAWMVEGGTPNTLLRAGLNKKSLTPGTPIIVRGYQSKDRLCAPACKANGRDITLSNGEKIFMGSSGTGAPKDGTDPRERGPVQTELPDAEDM